jgi:hypothetical protein
LQFIEQIHRIDEDIDLSAHVTQVVSIVYMRPPKNGALLSFKMACIEDSDLQQSFETAKGNKVKMDVSRLATEFFKNRGISCLGRMQPCASKFQDTLLLEVVITDPNDRNTIGFVLAPLLILSH